MDPAKVAEHILKIADKNEDGKLTKDEYDEKHKPYFEKNDANGDGKVCKVELTKAIAALQAKHRGGPPRRPAPKRPAPKQPSPAEAFVARVMNLDGNKDGKLNADEFPAPLRQHFGRVDTNNDGYVCKEELTKVADRLRAAVQNKKD